MDGVGRVVRVLPDVAAIDKEFDYLVPDGVEVHVGDVVRIDLHGRRVGGWIVAVDVSYIVGVAQSRYGTIASWRFAFAHASAISAHIVSLKEFI